MMTRSIDDSKEVLTKRPIDYIGARVEHQSVQVTLTDQTHQFESIRVDNTLFSSQYFIFQQIFLHIPNFSSVTRKESSSFLSRGTQFIEHKRLKKTHVTCTSTEGLLSQTTAFSAA